MKRVFERANWIWPKSYNEVNEYADFICEMDLKSVDDINLRIASKGDYAVWINGQFIGFNQYHDFPDLRAYDDYDISDFLKIGTNRLCVLGKVFNYDTASRIKDGKGVIFEVVQGGAPIYVSDQNVLSRIDLCYTSGEIYSVTTQLGMGFEFDFAGQDNWILAESDGFLPSCTFIKTCEFEPRPIERLVLTKHSADYIGNNIYDLGRESCGYLYFNIHCETECSLIVSYGEHLSDGCVRRKIDQRDFSMRFKLNKGLNTFREHFFRIGARYLELIAENELDVREIGINESLYPVNAVEIELSGVDRQIYDASVNTLLCCMHEHYEDCPWREQAQYTMDSRNQMLFGYYAFKEYKFARAGLIAMIHSLDDDNRMFLTTPSAVPLRINSFNLVYMLALCEYLEYSKDVSILSVVLKNAQKVMESYLGCVNNDGLLSNIKGWNFIEWYDGLSDADNIGNNVDDNNKYNLPLNCFWLIAIRCYARILSAAGVDNKRYLELEKRVAESIHRYFWDEDNKMYFTFYYDDTKDRCIYSEIAQVLAVYSNVCDERTKKILLDKITSVNDLIPISLSNLLYKYELLLRESKYDEYVMSDIKAKWGYMIDRGATSFWETILGDSDFNGAGSLCHGWSAVPIYVYHKLCKKA